MAWAVPDVSGVHVSPLAANAPATIVPPAPATQHAVVVGQAAAKSVPAMPDDADRQPCAPVTNASAPCSPPAAQTAPDAHASASRFSVVPMLAALDQLDPASFVMSRVPAVPTAPHTVVTGQETPPNALVSGSGVPAVHVLPSVVRTAAELVPFVPTATQLAVVRQATALSVASIGERADCQLPWPPQLPASPWRIVPIAPTAQHCVAVGHEIPRSWLLVGEACDTQLAPPSPVERIAPPSPTATQAVLVGHEIARRFAVPSDCACHVIARAAGASVAKDAAASAEPSR
jgi:hypothetical protein